MEEAVGVGSPTRPRKASTSTAMRYRPESTTVAEQSHAVLPVPESVRLRATHLTAWVSPVVVSLNLSLGSRRYRTRFPHGLRDSRPIISTEAPFATRSTSRSGYSPWLLRDSASNRHKT